MGTTTATTYAEPISEDRLISTKGWVWIGVLTLLFGLLHYEFLRRTWVIARNDNNWSHALLVPLISLFFLYQRRERLATTPRRLCWWGLPILFGGMFWYAFWIYGRVDMFRGYGMIVSLFGLTLFLLGPAMMRVLWFPIVYLVFAVKVSDLLWERIAQHLQDIAARGATFLMKMASVVLDFDVSTQGNTISIWHDWNDGRGWRVEGLNVHEVCSGLRMLMAFLALGTALAFLWDRAWWQRIVMVGLAVPIAVAVNILRVTTLGLLTLHDPALAHGDFHTFIGMLMLIPAAGMFLLVGWILDQIVIVEGGPDRAETTVRDAGVASPAEASHSHSRKIAAESDLPIRLPRRMATWGGVAVIVLAAAYLVWALYEPEAMSAGVVSTHAAVAARITLALVAAGAVLWFGWQHRAVWRGAFAGGVLSLLLALTLLFTLAVFKPGVILEGMSPAMAWTLLLATLAMVAVGGGLLPRLVRSDVLGGLATRHAMALGLVAGVLLVGWIGQNRLIAATGWVLAKEELPLRRPLASVAERAGPWRVQLIEPLLSDAIVQALGTDQYTSVRFEDVTWPGGNEGKIVRLHLAYYSGTVDTVAHVPERCITAGGASSVGAAAVTLNLNPKLYRPDPAGGYLATANGDETVHVPDIAVPGSLFRYAPPEGGEVQNVFYFFVANGTYRNSSYALRLAGFDPRDTYSYFCKVEMHIPGVTDPAVAQRRAEAFLSVMLPEIMRCLPDWQAVKAGDYPPDPDKIAQDVPTLQRPADTPRRWLPLGSAPPLTATLAPSLPIPGRPISE